MKTSVEESVRQILELVDNKGFTADQFCNAVRDQPVPSPQYRGCMCSEDIAQHYLSLAKNGQLAVFRAGIRDGDGKFTAFDIPWIYDARSSFISEMSVDMLKEAFPRVGVTNRHWGYTAECEIENGTYSDKTLPEVLYYWSEMARANKLDVEYEKVIPQDPYNSKINVTVTHG